MKKPEDTMEVLKTATCKTLSGKSTLTYQIGCTPDSTVHLRIQKNVGGGFFSNEFVSFDDIQSALKEHREGQAITSFLLIPVFSGKSANNSSFLLAILKHLKLVRPLPKKKREHEPRQAIVLMPLSSPHVMQVADTSSVVGYGFSCYRPGQKLAANSISDVTV